MGWYNPHTSEIEVDAEKLNHHLANGAQMSATVNNLLITRGVIKGEKVTSWRPKKRPQKEEETPKAEVKPAEEPKKEEPKAEESPVKEVPVEEVKAEEVEKTE